MGLARPDLAVGGRYQVAFLPGLGLGCPPHGQQGDDKRVQLKLQHLYHCKKGMMRVEHKPPCPWIHILPCIY